MANRAHLKRQFLNTWCMCVAYLDRITIRHSLYVGIWDLAYVGKYNLMYISSTCDTSINQYPKCDQEKNIRTCRSTQC